jgi:hypothetical protein
MLQATAAASSTQKVRLMRGVGNLCIGPGSDGRYDARRIVAARLAGLRSGPASITQKGWRLPWSSESTATMEPLPGATRRSRQPPRAQP